MGGYSYPNEQQEPDTWKLVGSARRRSMHDRKCDSCGGKIGKGQFYDRLCYKDSEVNDAGKHDVMTYVRHDSWCHENPQDLEPTDSQLRDDEQQVIDG